MMKKTGAGILWFGMGLFLSGAWGTATSAQDFPVAPPPRGGVVAPESESIDAAAPEAIAESAPRLPADQRLEALKTADLATLKAAQEECMKAAEEVTAKVPDLHQQMRQTYEDVRQNDPALQGIRQQIAELEANLEKLLANHPAVLEKRKAIDQAQQDMLAELRLRTALEGLIAAKEKEEPAPAEAEAAE